MEKDNSNNQEDYSLTEIQQDIINFNLDKTIDELKRYYATQSTWEIINQARKEVCHSQFLAWIFGNKDFNKDTNNGPIKRLIVLLLQCAKNQNNKDFNSLLEKSIYDQSLLIESYEVHTEVQIVEDSYDEGKIDILIQCIAKINEEKKGINIIIENKINAKETTKKDKGKKLYQTDAYYKYFNGKYENNINLFVFLKPTIDKLDDIKDIEKEGCHCNKYILTNYQVLLDNIIQPISERKDISEEDRFRLKDYIKALGKPAETDEKDNSKKRTIIMAMETNERELLRKFYNNNKKLILAAMNAVGDKNVKNSIANFKSKNYYKIKGQKESNEEYDMYGIIEKFIEYKLNGTTNNVEDLNNEFRKYIGGKLVYVSDDRNKEVYREYKKGKEHFGRITTIPNYEEIRFTKEWSDYQGSNFYKFRTRVSDAYKDFQIEQIQ